MMIKPHLIKTQFLKNKQQWTAFTTWRGMDIQENGETERNAVLFLLERHATYLGINTLADVNRIIDEKFNPSTKGL